MSEYAIRISVLSKVFRVWRQPRDMLFEALSGRRRHSDFQALTDINVDVAAGTVVGIMGRNGAGKSTLLRIVAGTLDATSGRVDVVGKVSAILELGTGFHPDYTGRENVFLGGLCLGLTRNEIGRRFDEIIDFAELGDVIDRPFRTYSSGMQARLTFAVATSVDAEVLIIDEALAVGDARFQLKSFDRVRRFRQQGKSILLVSHDINQIVSVCDRALLLDAGRVIADGNPGEVGNTYHELLFGPRPVAFEKPSLSAVADNLLAIQETHIVPPRAEIINDASTGQGLTNGAAASAPRASMEAALLSAEREAPFVSAESSEATAGGVKRDHRYGDGRARIAEVTLLDAARRPVSRLRSLDRYLLVCRIEALDPLDNLCFGFLVRDRRGLDLFGWDMQSAGLSPLSAFRAGEQRDISVLFCANMAAGEYFITVALARWHDGHKYDVHFDAHEFVVEHTPQLFTASVLNLDPQLQA
jgi:lipopolysaccharide transport system ATP-binding protein